MPGTAASGRRFDPHVDDQILVEVRRLAKKGPVHPYMLVNRTKRSERQLRRDFVRLVDAGELKRAGYRDGYMPVRWRRPGSGRPRDPQFDDKLYSLVRRLSRMYRAIHPHYLQPWLDELCEDQFRSERQLRRDLKRLWEQGKIERIGKRGGYWVSA